MAPAAGSPVSRPGRRTISDVTPRAGSRTLGLAAGGVFGMLLLAGLAGVLLPGGSPPAVASLSPSSQVHAELLSPEATSYNVTFSTFGLAAGVNWSVDLNGTVHTGNATLGPAAFSEINGTYAYTITATKGYTPDPASGSVTVAGRSVRVTVDILPPGYFAVTINELGLPAKTDWSLTFNGTVYNTAEATLDFVQLNGTFAYSVGSEPAYTAAPASGNVVVAGASVILNITFTAVPGEYQVTFTETGIATSGSSWSVTLGGTQKSASAGVPIVFAEANGSAGYTIGSVVGFTPNPSSGTVTVTGAAVSQAIVFTVTPGYYEVEFTETGLGVGVTSWTVTLAGASASSDTTRLAFLALNGTESYTVTPIAGYTATPASGNVVVNGAEVVVPIAFLSPGNYTLTFTESGLTPGIRWDVNSSSFFGRATAPSPIVAVLEDGTYTWNVVPPAGWTYTTSSGSPTTIAGADVSINVAFTPVKYPISFSETGLLAAASWTVTLNGTPMTGTAGNLIIFEEANGTYSYTIQGPADYTAPAGNVTNAGGASQLVTFTYKAPPPTLYAVTFNEVGLPTGTAWSVTFNNTLQSSTTSSIVFSGYKNATYTYSVGQVAGFNLLTSAGTVAVAGAQTVGVTFTAQVSHTTFAVTFAESGLADGVSWLVTVNNSVYSWTTAAGSTSWPVELENGTYSYSIPTPAGYSVVSGATSGTVEVSGSAVSAPLVTYTSSSSSSGSGSSSFLGSTTGLIVIGVVVLVVVVALVAVMMSRKKKQQPPAGGYDQQGPYGQPAAYGQPGGYQGGPQGGGPGYPPA